VVFVVESDRDIFLALLSQVPSCPPPEREEFGDLGMIGWSKKWATIFLKIV
jgi:hypothetical protein